MDNSNEKKINWGDIYYCDLGLMKGSVQSGKRPVIVVQTNRLNSSSPTVTVAVITSVLKKSNMLTHIEIGTECGLKEPSMIMLEQLRTVDKLEELEEYLGCVTDEQKILQIQKGLKYAVGLPIKPQQRRTGIIFSLCPHCREEFMNLPENIVKRLDPLQAEKEVCDKCQVRYGFDYIIIKRFNHKHKGGSEDV